MSKTTAALNAITKMLETVDMDSNAIVNTGFAVQGTSIKDGVMTIDLIDENAVTKTFQVVET